METQANLVSKVLVLDSDAECYKRIRTFCDSNNLVGLKAREENVVSVLKSNIDLGGVFLSERHSDKADGGIGLARKIHEIRPELPIFLRRENNVHMEDLAANDQKLFSAAYAIDDTKILYDAVSKRIFSLKYPNALVRGIAELTRSALEGQFKHVSVNVETPYIVRDRIIFGEIFTLIPIESHWCRGYMMLQADEAQLQRFVTADRTRVSVTEANDFRNLNNLLGEITNLIWGGFKNRYISMAERNASSTQIPIIVNHSHRYISFGSEDPQLCFKYSLTDTSNQDVQTLTILQRFVFNLNWSPDDFKENQTSVEALVESGELEIF